MISSLVFCTIALASTPIPGGKNGAIQVSRLKVLEGFHPLAFAAAPKGSRFVATVEDDSVRIMDAGLKETVKNLGSHPQPAMAVAWSHDGELIASGDESARIFEWNAE